SWAMPQFGIKLDAIPGLINESWFRVEEEGTYYGQCSELCGDYHGFMPIMVRAVSKEEFDAWTQQAMEEFARAGNVDVADREQQN
ncbi:MAG: cytochrome c oxidase subunit II, partial [Geminicoccaceae bacterium]